MLKSGSKNRTKERNRGMITQQNCPELPLLELHRLSFSGLSQSTPLSSFLDSSSKPKKKPQIATNKRIKANFGGRYDEPFAEIVISPSCSPMCNFTFTLVSRFHRRQPQFRSIWVKEKGSCKMDYRLNQPSCTVIITVI